MKKSDSSELREWALQKALTNWWLDSQHVLLAGEPFFLAAWEVMTDYQINDATRHWSQPSIDFLFLDRTGRIAAVELKRAVHTPREAWSVLCQVTHRAQVLGAAYKQGLLENAYRDCHSGLDGRRQPPGEFEELRLAHGRAFNQEPLETLPGAPARRFVMAKSYGAAFSGVLSAFTHGDKAAISAELAAYRGDRREFDRFLELQPDPKSLNPAPVHALSVPEARAVVGQSSG